MLTTILAAAFAVAQPLPLTSADVAQMMSVAIETAITTGPRPLATQVPRPLIIDAVGATEMIAALSPDAIVLDTAQWVEGKSRKFKRLFEALDCPAAKVSPACRLREDGTLVHLLKAERIPGSEALQLRINFITPPQNAHDGTVGGFTAVMRVEKVSGKWTAVLQWVAA